MYNKEKDFYNNFSYAQIKKLYWDSELIFGYVANDEINRNDGNKDKTSMMNYQEMVREIKDEFF